MPINDLVYNSDLAIYPYACGCGTSTSQTNGTETTKETEKIYVMMPPPPSKFPLYPIPYPPYPHPHGCDCDCDDKESSVKQSTIEKKICKLSKTAATLRTLIENISEKNKPVIVKAGSVSYSLGEYKTKTDDPDVVEEDESIESVIEILKTKLTEVKEEIKELSDQIETEP